MESFVLNEFWDPLCFLVINDELFLDVCNSDEPCVESSIDKRRLRSPAEGVTMDDCSRAKQSILFLEVGLNQIVSVLNEDSLVVGHLISEFTVLVNGADSLAGLDKALLHARGVIVLSEARGAVDHTCTSVGCYEFSTHHSKATLIFHVRKVRE